MQAILFSLVVVGASALRLGVPAGTGSTLRTGGQPHMGLAVGDQFPAEALKSFGVSGKKAVVFFYGADDAPSCKKELAAFDEFMDDFKTLGATVVGVRNAAGAKGADEVYGSMKIVVDDGDEVREQIGIEKDLFGLLGGRETYVVGPKGVVVGVHNNQFGPETHISTALTALESMPERLRLPRPLLLLPQVGASTCPSALTRSLRRKLPSDCADLLLIVRSYV